MFLEIRFLRNFRGAGDRNKKSVEWPPSPYRFYCALIEAFYNRYRASGTLANKNAIKNLETSAPTIFTEPNINKYENNMVWCPKNIGELANYNSNPINNSGVFVPFAATDKMYYEWDCNEEIVSMLPWVSRLGTCDSLIEVGINRPTGLFDVWNPQETYQGIEIRCPYPGVFEHLDEAFNDTDKSHEVKPVRKYYSHRKNVTVVNGVYDKIPKQHEMWECNYIRTLTSDLSLGIREIYDVAKSMRIAIGKTANQLKLFAFEEEVFSHSEKPHLAIVPLPFVLHDKYSTGDLKGILIILPKAMQAWRSDLEQCLRVIESFPFICNNEYCGDICLSDVNNKLKTTEIEAWSKPSLIWSSATPVGSLVLKSAEEQHAWCVRECEWLGLPKPIESISHRYSFWGFDSRELFKHYRDSNYNKLTKSILTNFTIKFPVKITGPILFGKHRNVGLGLMVPREGMS